MDPIRAAAARPLGNYGLFLNAPYEIALGPAPEPAMPPPGFALVQVKRVGICGSDVHMFKGEIRTAMPSVLGHEGSGVVYAVGQGVENVRPGDRVALEPVSRPRFVGGMISRFFTIPASHCYKLSDHISLEEAAFVEPFAVSYHGAARGNVGKGSRVLVLGAGPIGLNAILAAKALGAVWVGVTDINSQRLELAKKAGIGPRSASTRAV